MEIAVTAYAQVARADNAEEPEKGAAQAAALEAVEEALHYADNRGFNYPFADTLCVGIGDVCVEQSHPIGVG